MIRKCKNLKEEIQKRPRPVIDQNGVAVHKAVKSELNRGFMSNILSAQKQNAVRPMNC